MNGLSCMARLDFENAGKDAQKAFNGKIYPASTTIGEIM